MDEKVTQPAQNDSEVFFSDTEEDENSLHVDEQTQEPDRLQEAPETLSKTLISEIDASHDTSDDLSFAEITDKDLTAMLEQAIDAWEKEVPDEHSTLLGLQFSPRAYELLKALHLSNQATTNGIHATALNRALDQTRYGKFLEFLMSTSVARTLLLWPFLSRKSIKLPKSMAFHLDHSTSFGKFAKISAPVFEDAVLASDSTIQSGHETGSPLLLTTEDDEEAESTTDTQREEGTPSESVFSETDVENDQPELATTSIQASTDMDEPEPLWSENTETGIQSLPHRVQDGEFADTESRCIRSFPILTTRGVLFESDATLRQVYGVIAFHETAEVLVEGVWGAFASSLLINTFINFYLCPSAFPSIMDKLIEISTLPDRIDESLGISLNKSYLLAPLVGIPVLLGTLNALRAAYQVKAFNRRQTTQLLEHLERHHPGCCTDVGGWIFTGVIPDFIPAVLLLALLPQPAAKHALEHIKHRIIWDGRLSAKERLALFEGLRLFSRHHHRLTQMYALSTLAGVVQGINLHQLARLQKAGVDNETLTALMGIKAEALHELRFMANHYHLPLEQGSCNAFRPLPRYLYTNYVLWAIGYPQKVYLQPIFFGYKGFKLLLTVMFYYAIASGIKRIYENYQKEIECGRKGKEFRWLWMEAIDNYECSVCGDWPIFYRYISSIEKCFEGYLALPRTLDQLLTFIDRFDLSNITSMDLSAQAIFVQNQTALSIFLILLKPKMRRLKTVIFNPDPEDFKLDLLATFANFVQNSSIVNLTYSGRISQETFDAFAKGLPSTRINTLDLSWGYDTSLNFALFVSALQNSTITDLNFYPASDENTQAIAHMLSGSILKKLTLDGNMTSQSCKALAEKLPQSQIHYLSLPDHAVFGSGDFSCLEMLTNATAYHNFTFDISDEADVGDIEMMALGKALSHKPPLPLSRLELAVSASQQNLLEFIRAISASPLLNLILEGGGRENYNYTTLIPQLVDALGESNVTQFSLGFFLSPLGDEDAELLASFLPTKLQKLIMLGLSSNNIGSKGMRAIAQVLNKTDIRSLDLSFNDIGEDIKSIEPILLETNITVLDISLNNLHSKDMAFLVDTLKKSTIEELYLGNNEDIGDEGAAALIEGLLDVPLKSLDLGMNNITDQGAQKIAKFLTTEKPRPRLWIDQLNTAQQQSRALAQKPKIALTEFDFSGNSIRDEGAKALCQVLPQTNFLYGLVILSLATQQNQTKEGIVSQAIIDNCGVVSDATFDDLLTCNSSVDNLLTSNTHTLRPAWIWLLTYRIYSTMRQSISDALFNLPVLMPKRYPLKSRHPSTMRPQSISNTPATVHPSEILNTLDASYYEGSESIIVNFDPTQPISNRIGNQPLSVASNTNAFKASRYSNHFLTGGEKTVWDTTENQGINLIRIGKNNALRLGFWSQDHIVVTPNQGIIKVQGFNLKDTLHMIDPQTIYPETFVLSCRDHTVKPGTSMAIVSLKNTQVHLMNTSCKAIHDQTTINDPKAIYAAYQATTRPKTSAYLMLYTGLLTLCETFLRSVNQSALLTAIPLFVTEVCCRYTGHTRDQAEAFGQQIQRDILLSFASPQGITASYLAAYLASYFTKSPKIISMASISASITTTVLRAVLTENIALTWAVLQAGVAATGAILGGYGIQKSSEITQWGLNKIRQTPSYFKASFSFWSLPRSTDQAKPSTENSAQNLALS
jgi:hypothetical protein